MDQLELESVEKFLLKDSSFQENATIHLYNTTKVIIRRSSFLSNTRASPQHSGLTSDEITECCSSGALYVYNSSLQVHQSVFSDNIGYVVGAILGEDSNITIEDSTFMNNYGYRHVYRSPSNDSSGALYLRNGSLLLVNGNFSGNVAMNERWSSAGQWFEIYRNLQLQLDQKQSIF